jgi:signal transduction histidine kinase
LWLELSAAILIALLVSNAITVAIITSKRAAETREERLSTMENRVAAVAALLAQVPQSERDKLLKVASIAGERVTIGAHPRVGADAPRDTTAENRLRKTLGANADIRIAKRGAPDLTLFGPRSRNPERLALAIGLGTNKWLNAEFVWPPGASLVPELIFASLVAALALLAVAIWLSFRFSGPLQRLSHASEKMADGKSVEPVPETGPFALRKAARAFNTMSRRLMAMLENQRTLIASIAHDLRTPITSLVIKSEFITDGDLKERMRVSLEELQTMTEAALEAAQTGMGEERAREIDVTALIESMCADLADMGGDVTFLDSPSLNAVCRPNEIRRASRNLVENALRYGTRARVSVSGEGDLITITVDDDGPGLKPDEAARVFDPFVRLESSRDHSTGGYGLGLTLARTIARTHGGDITLTNRESGGLRATLTFRRD